MHNSARNILLMCMVFFIVIILFFPTSSFVGVTLPGTSKSLDLYVLLGLKVWSVLLLFLLIAALFFFKESIRSFFYDSKFLIVQDRKALCQLSPSQKRLLVFVFLVIIGCRIYSIQNYLLNTDEAWLYQVYGGRNPFYVIGWFPLPSNHVFHTFWATIGSFFVADNPILGMRIPSLIIGVITSFVLFLGVLKTKGYKVAFIVLILFNCIEGVIWSQTAARGYGFLVLFHLINVFCFFRWKNTGAKHAFVCFVISSVFGLFTTFSFFYYWLALGLVWSYFAFKKVVLSMAATLLIAALMYVPIFLINDLSSLSTLYTLNDFYVAPLHYIESLALSYEWSFFTKHGWIIPLFVVTLFLFQRKDTWLLALVIIPIVLALVHGLIPSGKIWVPQMVVIILMGSEMINKKWASYKTKWYLGVVGIFALLISQYYFFNSHHRVQRQERYELAVDLLEEKLDLTIYDKIVSHDDYLLTIANYRKKIYGYDYELVYANPIHHPVQPRQLVIQHKEISTNELDTLKLKKIVETNYYKVWTSNPIQ